MVTFDPKDSLHVDFVVAASLLCLSLCLPQKHHKLDISMLSYDVAILYSFFMNPGKVKDRMDMP